MREEITTQRSTASLQARVFADSGVLNGRGGKEIKVPARSRCDSLDSGVLDGRGGLVIEENSPGIGVAAIPTELVLLRSDLLLPRCGTPPARRSALLSLMIVLSTRKLLSLSKSTPPATSALFSVITLSRMVISPNQSSIPPAYRADSSNGPILHRDRAEDPSRLPPPEELETLSSMMVPRTRRSVSYTKTPLPAFPSTVESKIESPAEKPNRPAVSHDGSLSSPPVTVTPANSTSTPGHEVRGQVGTHRKRNRDRHRR